MKRLQKQLNRQEKARTFIEENYLMSDRLRRDVIRDQVQLRDADNQWRDITTADINDIVCAVSAESDMAISAKEVMAVLFSHQVPDVHPLREYVGACPPYDDSSPDWIGWLASLVTVEGDETEQNRWKRCFIKWFVAMVASWLRDDIVNQQVLVLIGRQGIYKTTWLDYLLPPELRLYGCKMANATQLNKDERLRIAEYGLIALDEIDSMGLKELNVMKSVITAADVAERAAYRMNKERRIRLASFCASGNKREFLTDMSGNRRWLPFTVTNITSPRDLSIPYQQIYAQALYLFEHHFQYWFDLSDIEEIEQHNEQFRAQENEEQLLEVYFDIPAEGTGKFMTTAEISDKLVINGSIKKPMSLSRLGMVLQKFGYQSKRIGKSGTRGWIVRERDADEINANRNLAARDEY